MRFNWPTRYDFVPDFYRLTLINVLFHITEPICSAISLAFLGHLQALDDLEGVASVAPLFTSLYSLSLFLRMGTTGLAAQMVGRDDRTGLILIGLRNSAIALVIGWGMVWFQFPIEAIWFNHSMGGGVEGHPFGTDYFATRIWGTPAVLVNLVLVGWLLGQERSLIVLFMSLVSHAAAIGMDYLFVIRYHWGSSGAGLSQTFSQYLLMVLGLILIARDVDSREVSSGLKQFWDLSAFKSIFTLNGNIFVRSLCNNTAYVAFFSLSAIMGTSTLLENTLLMQAASFGVYFAEGVGFTTETLVGHFEGQGLQNRWGPILQVAVATSLVTCLGLVGIYTLFPQTILGLLTNHSHVLMLMGRDVVWLFLFSSAIALYTVLDAYFAGLAKGYVLRNASLLGLVFGFSPVAWLAWHLQNNTLLWLAISTAFIVKTITLLAHWWLHLKTYNKTFHNNQSHTGKVQIDQEL